MDLLSALLEQKILALILFTILSIVIAIFIVIIQKKPEKKPEKEDYASKLNKITEHKTSEEQLSAMNLLFKTYLIEKFNIKNSLEYEDIKEKISHPKIREICNLMIEAYYSNEKVNPATVTKIHFKLKELFEETSETSIKSKGRYYESKDLTEPPIVNKDNSRTIRKTTQKTEPKSEIRHGKDNYNSVSVYAKKEHALKAKENFHQAKRHIKSIHKSMVNSKKGAINENMSITDWAEELSDIKSEMIDDYKKMISKL